MCNYVIDQIFNLHPQISICIFNYMYIISTIYQLILVISINKFLNEKKYYDWDQNEKYISTTSSIGNIFKSRDSNEIH